MRWPQRLSSLAFGTAVGRFLTRYLALPFGGAYVILEAIQHVAALFGDYFEAQTYLHVATWPLVALLGVVLLGILYYQRFRALCLAGVANAGRLGRLLFYELPRQVVSLQFVQAIVRSRVFQWFRRYALKPTIITGLVLAASYVFDFTLAYTGWFLVFLGATVLRQLAAGPQCRRADYRLGAAHLVQAARCTYSCRAVPAGDGPVQPLAGIDRAAAVHGRRVAALSRRRAAGGHRGQSRAGIHLVFRRLRDPLLRHADGRAAGQPDQALSRRHGFSQTAAAGEPGHQDDSRRPTGSGLGLGHRGLHAVLVSRHRRLFGVGTERKLATVRGQSTARAAARAIGHHGETMVQFLRPGFRSGTLPKLYAKLRRASRKAAWTHNWKACDKQISTACTTPAKPFAASSIANCWHCCTQAATGPTTRSPPAKSAWGSTAS